MRLAALLSCVAVTWLSWAGPPPPDDNLCDEPGDAPDVVVGAIYMKWRWGEVDGVTSFSIGTTACNSGTCWLNWFVENQHHPVIGQNMFRLKDGRFEQVGQSWLKHSFFALSQDYCSDDCLPTQGRHLGVNCSDPYSAFLNGDQDALGPKSEVNASTGDFPFPATDQELLGDEIFKRLQVRNEDLDPDLNAGALYFVEGHYVARDDALAGNGNNNASYRPARVFSTGDTLDFDLIDTTVPEVPAIYAWAANDSGVQIYEYDVPEDGRFIVASKATELGDGLWHYEYAIQNLNSHRSARAFRVPFVAGAEISNIGFHDVDYHSGETLDGTDWAGAVDVGSTPNAVVWTTDGHDANPNANALRWGTLYNFRFDADVAPGHGQARLELFRPGSPGEIAVEAAVPRVCDLDGTCDAEESACDCPEDCHPPSTETACDDLVDEDCDGLIDCEDPDCDVNDPDGDGFGDCTDCDNADPAIHPGTAELCDGRDNDCDASTVDGAAEPWFGQACDGPDGDVCVEGVIDCLAGVETCTDDSGDDLELCGDGLDNDCDGLVDEAGGCGDGIVEAGETCDDGNGTNFDGCSALCALEQVAPNVVANGDFETGELLPWRWHTDATGSAQVVGGVARLETTTLGSNTQFFQRDVAVTGGSTYRLRFTASCENSGGSCGRVPDDAAMAVIFQRNETPFTNLGLLWELALTPCPRTYVAEFTTPLAPGVADVGRLRFRFDGFAGTGNVYTLDDVHLEERCRPGNPEGCDGVDNDCDAGVDEDQDADGFVACDDCDNADGGVYPGAVEANDGKDNQCPGDPGYGQVDELAQGSGFTKPGDKAELSWTSQPGATSYEVARSSGPLFTADCWTSTTTESFVIDAELPTTGGGFFYLIRALAPNPGSWGQHSSGLERTDVCP